MTQAPFVLTITVTSGGKSEMRGMMTRATAGLLALGFATSFSPTEARASGRMEYLTVRPGAASPVARFVDDNDSIAIVINSAFGYGFASDAEVRRLVGTPTYRVTNCSGPARERIVEAYLQTQLYDYATVLDQVLRRAALYVWRHCPKPTPDEIGPDSHSLVVAAARIYLPDGTLAIEAQGLFSQASTVNGGRGYDYSWSRWTNYPVQAREQAQRAQQARQGQSNPISVFIADVWWWAKFLFFSGLVLWICSKWEPILRWWYDLTPHPARELVDAAIHQGRPIDMDAFDRALVVHPANEIERSVRENQLREATQRLRNHHQALSREEAERVARERALAAQRAEAEREYRMGRAQEEALKAALEHQVTAARVEALRKRERNDD